MAGESRNLEYKADMTNSFLKTVSAYANYGAGEIRFGISDDGERVGVKEPEAFALSVENKINDAIEPKPNFSMALDGDVVILRVAKGMDPPYTYRGKAYKRNHTATVEVSREEMRRLVLEGTGKSFDQLAAREETLTFSCLAEDLSTRLGIGSISQDILKTLGLYHDQEGYNNAAALLADENAFPGIDVVRFGAGLDEIVERERFSGVSVLLQYKRVVEMFQRYYQYEAIKGFSRVDCSGQSVSRGDSQCPGASDVGLCAAYPGDDVCRQDRGSIARRSSDGHLGGGVSARQYFPSTQSCIGKCVVSPAVY